MANLLKFKLCTESIPAHNSIDLSQVTVPVKPAAASQPVAAPLQGHVIRQPVASAQQRPVTSSTMAQVVDAPKLNVRFPSFVTEEMLIKNSIDRLGHTGRNSATLRKNLTSHNNYIMIFS